MPTREVYEVTLTCSTPECPAFVTERSNICAIDTSRMREDLARRGWTPWAGPDKDGWSRAVDLCPSCSQRPEAKKLLTKAKKIGRWQDLGTLPARSGSKSPRSEEKLDAH